MTSVAACAVAFQLIIVGVIHVPNIIITTSIDIIVIILVTVITGFKGVVCASHIRGQCDHLSSCGEGEKNRIVTKKKEFKRGQFKRAMNK